MPAKLFAGPYDFITVGPQTQAPWYVIPFDDRGRCTAPLTRKHLIDTAKQGDFTDIYLFSHGWNNDWRDAVGDDPSGIASGGGYRGFIERYAKLRHDHNLAYARPYKPLLIGIFWPSAWLVLPWETAPQMAAEDPELADTAVAQERRALEEIAKLLDEDDVEAFYGYAQQEKLSEAEARELARIMLPIYNHASGTGPGDAPAVEGAVAPEQIVDLWRKIGQREKPLDTGTAGGRLRGTGATPRIAGVLDSFDPRMIVRGASVWTMKDRAGSVGALGVADLLSDLLAASATARAHLIGHSFGCRVLLSAICAPAALPRKIDSALLIQPAVSHLCFAESVPGSGKPGGYRTALQRIEQPILLTFSKEDQPLHDFFHLALIRSSDLGEAQIAGDDEPPNAYAALGGYGPRGYLAGECEIIPIKSVGDSYDLGANAPRIYALNGAGVIHGHSDFNKDATWWVLYSQVAR
jgi:pimeloyl-ACP methyl ester carboxylesterase